MNWFWLALAIGLAVVEISTTQLVCIWFSIGAAVTAIITSIFGSLGLPWQIMIFVGVSVILLLSTRRLVKKFLSSRGKENATNLDLYIGKDAIVVEEINNIKGQGAVRINGLTWTARSDDETVIAVDTIVTFKKINGNKAIVAIKGEK